MSTVQAMDPGNRDSAYCIVDLDSRRPVEFGTLDNQAMLEHLIAPAPYDRA